MKITKIIISVLFISLFVVTISSAEDCSKYEKLSKEYTKCTSGNFKKETSKKIEEGKKKFKNFNLKDKLKKFKNSKTLKEFIQK